NGRPAEQCIYNVTYFHIQYHQVANYHSLDDVEHSPHNIDIKPGLVEIFAFAEFCFRAFEGLLVYQCHDERAWPQHRANEHQTYDRGVKRRYEREHRMQMNQITSSNNAQGNNQGD